MVVGMVGGNDSIHCQLDIQQHLKRALQTSYHQLFSSVSGCNLFFTEIRQ